MMPTNIGNYHPELSEFGSHFRTSCLALSWSSAFVSRPVFRNLWGVPLGPIWPPLRHPWSDCVTFLKYVGSKFAPNFKESRATNATNHTCNKNKQGLTKSIPINNPNESCFTFVVKQSRASPKPQAFLKVGRRNSRKDSIFYI